MASTFANSRGRRRCAAVAAVMLFAGAGCVGAPGASQSETASPSASPTATLSATPDATYDLSSLPLAPSGEWKSIHWVQVSATPVIPPPSPDPESSLQPSATNFKVAGWSRGYVGFSVQVLDMLDWAGDATIATTYSSDGVHWHDGTVLKQKTSVDDLAIRGVFEGPSGLLAVGESGACGDAWIEALWTSRDGTSWQPVDMKKAFGKATIENVSGGSSGFVAVDSTGRAAWTSRDGQSWQPVKLGVPAFARSRIDDGTAFSGGYVLAGSTEVTGARGCGAIAFDPSAPPTPAPPMRSPTIWWSPDGGTWTKTELPGGTTAYWVQMSVCRANDRALIAFESYNSDQNSGNAFWISSDGRTWRFAGPSRFYPSEILTDGRHGVVIETHDPVDSSSGSTSISMLTDEGGLMAPAQGGDQPPYEWNQQWAIGPTGLLVSDGSQLWIGLPSEG